MRASSPADLNFSLIAAPIAESTIKHDWRGYLWLDYDLSPLPCSAQAEASQKGYCGKKTLLDGN